MIGAAAREGYSLVLQGADTVAKIFGDGLFSEEKRKQILEDENKALKDQARLRKLLFSGPSEKFKAPKLDKTVGGMADTPTTKTAGSATSTSTGVSSTISGGTRGGGAITVNIESLIGNQTVNGSGTAEQIKDQVTRAMQQLFTEIRIATG